MRHHTRTLAVLLMALPLVVGCSRAARDQRVSQAPSPPPAGVSTPTDAATPIPGHPPVTTTGIISSVDPATGIVTFKDGRMVKLTNQSKVLKAVETATVRPGEQVVVRNALPVGVPSTSKTSGSGKRQRMATVASVDAPNQLVRLTDGTSIRVTPSTQIRMGSAGQTMVLADLRPGDELVIVVAESGPTSTGTDATAASSALPRQTVSPIPADASEVMVFREIQAP